MKLPAPIMAADAWLDRHERLIGILGGIWFALVCADYAGFIRLPKIVSLPASIGFLAAFLRYGVWEAFVAPEIAAQRKAAKRDKAGSAS